MSFLADAKVLGEREALKRLSQVVKDRVDLQLVISKAEEIKKKK